MYILNCFVDLSPFALRLPSLVSGLPFLNSSSVCTARTYTRYHTWSLLLTDVTMDRVSNPSEHMHSSVLPGMNVYRRWYIKFPSIQSTLFYLMKCHRALFQAETYDNTPS